MHSASWGVAGNMKCGICHGAMERQFQTRLLNRYDVTYFYCQGCGFLCTEKPYWLQEAYSTAIASTDTGIITRNQAITQRLTAFLFFSLCERGPSHWLDYAGGHGLLVRMMRDQGFNFFWYDRYASNLFARGFEHTDPSRYKGVTAIEVMEHVESPRAFIEEIVSAAAPDVVIFTTETFPEGTPPSPEKWWYYARETGQHISFYQARTLKVLAEQTGFIYYSSGILHLFSRRPLSKFQLAVSKGKASKVLAPIVTRMLRSRTMSDHDTLAVGLMENSFVAIDDGH